MDINPAKLDGTTRLCTIPTVDRFRIHQIDLASGRKLKSWVLQRPADGSRGQWYACTSNDGRWAIALSSDGACSLINLQTGAEQAKALNLNLKRLMGVAFAPDGQSVSLVGENGIARLRAKSRRGAWLFHRTVPSWQQALRRLPSGAPAIGSQ